MLVFLGLPLLNLFFVSALANPVCDDSDFAQKDGKQKRCRKYVKFPAHICDYLLATRWDLTYSERASASFAVIPYSV